MKIYFIIISLFLFASCNKKVADKPAQLLDKSKMEMVLWDIVKINVYGKNVLSKDTTLDVRDQMAALERGVFEKHKVSSEVFYESFDYYLRNPDVLVTIMDSMMVHNADLPIDTTIKKKRKDLKLQLNE